MKPSLDDSTLLIYIDPYVIKPSKNNRQTPKVIKFIEKHNVNYFFLTPYDSPSFLNNDKWCGAGSKRQSLDNRIFTTKIKDYKISVKAKKEEVQQIVCSDIVRWEPPVHKNIISTSAFFISDLMNMLDSYPIKNVVIAGEAWEKCVRFRSLGLENIVPLLSRYEDVNLIIDISMIGRMSTSNNKNPSLLGKNKKSVLGEPCWKHIESTLFYLPKDKYDLYLDKYLDKYQKEYPTTHKPQCRNIILNLNSAISGKHITLDLSDTVTGEETLN